MIVEILKELEDKMKKALDFFHQEMRTIRAGRANVAILDSIKVEYYGEKMPMNQVANLSVADATTIIIDPWDKGAIKAIEKAIELSDLHISPSNDGMVIRLNIPPLTQERRQEILKVAKKKVEESKVAIRNIRRDGNEKVKKSEKDALISEDDAKKTQDKIQQLTDQYILKVDESFHHKEKEILEV